MLSLPESSVGKMKTVVRSSAAKDGLSTAPSVAPAMSGRLPSVAKSVILGLAVTVLTLELPGRFLFTFIESRAFANAMLTGVYPEALRPKLAHDFIDPQTRIQYEYDMFLGWRAKPDQRGFTYRINAAGHRGADDSSATGTRAVFLTGGSAAWSFGASDEEHTIASCLERRVNEMVGDGRAVNVINLSEQAYGLRQETQVVLDQLATIRPEVVVFYDGVNDVSTIEQGRDPNRYRTWSTFSEILAAALRESTGSDFVLASSDLSRLSMTWLAGKRLLRVAGLTRRQPEPTAVSEQEARQIRDFFGDRIRHSGRLLSELGIAPIFVMQPIAHIGKPVNERERFLLSDPRRSWWQSAYALLEDEYRSLDGVGAITAVPLTGVFASEQRQTYIDFTHMNDLGNEIVCDALAPIVVSKLRPAGPTSEALARSGVATGG